jgi:phytoene dehydrogenase-like protein
VFIFIFIVFLECEFIIKGMDSILVLVPCPTLVRQKELAFVPRTEALAIYEKQFTKEYMDSIRNAINRRIEMIIPHFSTLILHEVIDTPITYANQYNVGGGTPFGLSHGLNQLSIFRPNGKRKQEQQGHMWWSSFVPSFIYDRLNRNKNSGSRITQHNRQRRIETKEDGTATTTSKQNHNKTNKNMNNILFCGASTRPGNGVPLVFGSKLIAKQAMDQIHKIMREKQKTVAARPGPK